MNNQILLVVKNYFRQKYSSSMGGSDYVTIYDLTKTLNNIEGFRLPAKSKGPV